MKEFRVKLWKSTQRVIEKSLDTYKKANPHRYDNPEKYVEILNEFYSEEADRRIALRKKVEKDKERMIPAVLHAMSDRTNIINTMVDWCWTYNPKNVAKQLPASIPWIPWPDQIKFIEWIYTRYITQTRGMIKKTREQGATWVFCMVMLQEWRWSHGFAGGIGSNKLDNVDKRDEPDCIFEKLRALMKGLPPWWFPKGFNWKKHDKIGNMVRYTDTGEMGAQLSGQGGDQIGRGGRRSMYFVDEFASLDNPGEADFALSKNTDCQLDLSTPRGPNFFKQKIDNAEFIYTLHWKNNPMLDENWYARQIKEFSKEIVAQEIDIDFQASVEGLFIEPKWVDAAIGFELKAYGDNQSGLDVAAGGADLSAYANRIGPAITEMYQWNFKNGIDLTHVAAEKANKDGAGVLNYDEIGVGFAVESAFDRTDADIDFEAYGLNAGGGVSDLEYPEYRDKKAKDIFLNARCEWWYMMRKRCEKTYEHVNKIKEYPLDELISIPKNHLLTEKLKQELTSPMRMWTPNGKMKCESKEDMRKRGIKSPNCFIAGTLINTPKGKIPIEDLYVGDKVNTPMGVRTIIKTWESETHELTEAFFSNNKTLKGKGSHKVFTWDKGLIPLDSLVLDNYIESYTIGRRLKWFLRRFFTKANPIGFKPRAENITCQVGMMTRKDFFIEGYGEMLTGISQKGLSSTIKMVINMTTGLRILKPLKTGFMRQIICEITLTMKPIERKIRSIWLKLDRLLWSGTNLKKVGNGTRNMVKSVGLVGKGDTESSVYNAEKYLCHLNLTQSTVKENAGLNGNTTTTTRKNILVLFVEKLLWLINIKFNSVVPVNVERRSLISPKKVYNITLDRDNVYYANGILVENCADAVILSFVPKDGGRKHVVDTRFTTKEFNVIWDSKDFIPRYCKNYGAICQLDDMSINAICVVWHEHAGILYIYDELVMPMPDPDEIAQKLNWRMRLKEFKLEKIFGNAKMFAEDGEKSVAKLIKKAFKKSNQDQIVKIREPRKYDPMGSLTIINRLIKEKKMVVSSQCKEVNRQLSTWRIDKGKPKETGMREGLLMIVSELKRNIPFKEILRRMEYSTKTLKQYEPEPLVTELPKFDK